MNRISSRRPQPSEYESDYHKGLIEKVEGDCVIRVLEDQMFWLCELASHLSTEQVDKIHPPFGWTIRQVFEHCATAERTMGYRMVRFAAGDATVLPGWDETEYADRRYGLGNFGHIVTELGHLRQANVLLLRRLVPRAWDRQGTADGVRLSVRALAWVTAGHLHHHLQIVEQRCQTKVPRTPTDATATTKM